MTGKQSLEVALEGDTVKVDTLLSTQDSQSFINYQDKHGSTSLHNVPDKGHETVTKQLISARCIVELHLTNGLTPIHLTVVRGHVSVMKQLNASHCNVNHQDDVGTLRSTTRPELFITAPCIDQ